MSEALPALAALLEASNEPDPALLLGRVLGSLQLHVLVTDRSPNLVVKYGSSRVLESVPAHRRPIAGRPVAEVLPALAVNGVLEILREVAATGRPRQFRRFEYPVTRRQVAWDGAIHPLRDAGGGPGYLLIAAAESSAPQARLSAREREVAELVAGGLTNAAIASRLFVGRSTVATHVAHILEKLGFRSRSQVGAWLEDQRTESSRARTQP